MFLATDIRLKRPTRSPLSFQHHKAILKLDHNTSSKSSSASTTTPTKLLLLNSETTPKQSTSTNTPSTITVTITIANTAITIHTAGTIYTNTTTHTTTTTNTSTETNIQISAPMQLNIPISPRFRTPSTSITIALSSSISPSPIFSRTLQDLQQLELWGGSPTIRTTTTKGGHHHFSLLKILCIQGTNEHKRNTPKI